MIFDYDMSWNIDYEDINGELKHFPCHFPCQKVYLFRWGNVITDFSFSVYEYPDFTSRYELTVCFLKRNAYSIFNFYCKYDCYQKEQNMKTYSFPNFCLGTNKLYKQQITNKIDAFKNEHPILCKFLLTEKMMNKQLIQIRKKLFAINGL